MQIYNLGIGLTAVDSASPSIRTVDDSLRTLSGRVRDFDVSALTSGFKDVQVAGHELHMTLTGRSLDQDMIAVKEESEKAESKLGKLWNRFKGLTDTSKEFHESSLQARDGIGRFTDVKFNSRLDAMAGNAAALVDEVQEVGRSTYEAAKGGIGMLGKSLSALGAKIHESTGKFEEFLATGPGGNQDIFDFEHATHQMATALGGAGERAESMRSEILALGATTQFSVGQITALAQEMARAGVGIDEMSKRSQEAAINLQNTFGVAGDAIAKATRTVGAFGGDFNDTLDETARTVKAFEVDARGAFQALPGVIGFAQESMVRFGKAVVGDGKKIVKNVMGMGATFSKTFGKTMAEAINDAQAHFSRFATATKTSRRVFLGLADDFDPLTTALMEAGVGFGDTGNVLRKAQDDALGFSGEMRSLVEQLGGAGSFRGARLIEQLRDELPEATMRLIENDEEYARAFEQNALARQRSAELEGSGFADLSNEMLNTTKALKEMWDNTKQLLKITLGQIWTTLELKDVFRDVKDTFAGFANSLREFIMSDKFKSWLETIKPLVQTVGKTVLYLGTVFGGAAAGLGSLLGGLASAKGALAVTGKVLKPVAGRLGFLGRILGPIGKLFGFIGKKGLKLVPGLGQIIAVVSGIKTAFEDMGDALGDPMASGSEKVLRVIRGLLKGVGGAINGMLLGIPGFVLDKFFPDLERKFDRGFAGVIAMFGGMDFTGMLKSVFNKATTWLGEKLGGLGTWMVSRLPDWMDMAQDWGKTIGGAMGGLGQMAADALIWSIKNLSLPGMLYNIWQWAFSESMTGATDAIGAGGPSIANAISDIFWSIAGVAQSIVVGIAEGFLASFGESFDSLLILATMNWINIEQGINDAMWAAQNTVMNFVDAAAEFFGNLVLGAVGAFVSIRAQATGIFLALGNAVSGVINDYILEPIRFMVKGVVDGFVGMLKSILEKLQSVANKAAEWNLIDPETAAGISAMADGLTGAGDAAAALVPKLATLNDEQMALAQGQIQKDAAAQLATVDAVSGAFRKGFEERKAAREEERRRDQERADAAMMALSDELAVIDKKKKAEQERTHAVREWREATNQGLDAVFSRMKGSAAEHGGLNAQQLDVFDSKIRDSLESSLATISKQAAAGEMTMDEAKKAWEEAKIAGMESAMQAAKDAVRGGQKAAETAKTPQDAANAATPGGPGGAGGPTDPAIMRQLISAMASAGGRVEKVDVNLRGAGAIDKAIAQQSTVDKFNNGN